MLPAPDVHLPAATIALVFAAPLPIVVNCGATPEEPKYWLVSEHHGANVSVAEPFQPDTADSKYLLVVFAPADGVMKIFPPPGPVSPT